MSCLLTAIVNGYRRVPEPPARMMPFLDCGLSDFGLRISDCGFEGTGNGDYAIRLRRGGGSGRFFNPQSAIPNPQLFQPTPRRSRAYFFEVMSAAQERWVRYQSTVFSMPVANDSCGFQPSSR